MFPRAYRERKIDFLVIRTGFWFSAAQLFRDVPDLAISFATRTRAHLRCILSSNLSCDTHRQMLDDVPQIILIHCFIRWTQSFQLRERKSISSDVKRFTRALWQYSRSRSRFPQCGSPSGKDGKLGNYFKIYADIVRDSLLA